MKIKYVNRKGMPRKQLPKKSKKATKKVPDYVKQAIKATISRKAETKKYGTQAMEQSIATSSAGVVYSDLSQMAQGTTAATRIGAKISPTYCKIRYLLHNNGLVPVYVRVVLLEADAGSFTANTEEFLMDATAGGQALVAERLSDIVFPLNVMEYKVHYDKVHRIAGLGDGTGIECIRGEISKKLAGTMVYEDTSASDAKSKNLRLLVFSRCADNDTTAQTVEFTYFTQLYYKDM